MCNVAYTVKRLNELSKTIPFNLVIGVCGRTGKEIQDIEECPFDE